MRKEINKNLEDLVRGVLRYSSECPVSKEDVKEVLKITIEEQVVLFVEGFSYLEENEEILQETLSDLLIGDVIIEDLGLTLESEVDTQYQITFEDLMEGCDWTKDIVNTYINNMIYTYCQERYNSTKM